ncbi:hypothetical protein [Pragia fontium]|uniref:hypothetical protein n=1 Tax=Pragia fontium TaxID=82985 RepID=UPI00064B1D4B|nr:hypothetical protein [Pragia fontium]AKJ43326.1 hypothetical protein QQ39_15710 [Pragia fontium]
MKQFIWALLTIAGTLSNTPARATDELMKLIDDNQHHTSVQNWTEITGLPGQLSNNWELVETDLSSIWLLKNEIDPNLLGRISAQQLEDSVQLKDEVDAIAESFEFQSAKLKRSTEVYGEVSTEQLEVSTKDGNQDISGIFVLMNYQNKLYTLLLTSHYDIARLKQHKNNLMDGIFLTKK